MIATLPHVEQRRGMSEVPTSLWTPEGFLVEDEDGEFRPYKDFRPRDVEYRIIRGVRCLVDAEGEVHRPRIAGGAQGNGYRLVQGTVFAMTTGAKTAMMAIAPTAYGLALSEFAVSFDGVTASAVPALVELVRSTQAGAGTSGVSMTVTQVRGNVVTATSTVTGGSNYTAEPTTLTSIARWYIPQFMGAYTYQAPLGRETECDASGGTNKGLGVRITVTANVNEVGHLEVEARA
jgi:hypothetical protein